MKSIPARVDGDFVLIEYQKGFQNAVLAGGDRPHLAARGYLEGKIYTYAKTAEDDTFEEYEPGMWRRYEHSIWCKRLTSLSQLRNATIYKVPRYRGVLVAEMAWPLHTADGTLIQVVLDSPACRLAPRCFEDEIADLRMLPRSDPQQERVKFEDVVPTLLAEGWRPYLGDGGYCKVIPVTDLELEPELGVPVFLQKLLADRT